MKEYRKNLAQSVLTWQDLQLTCARHRHPQIQKVQGRRLHFNSNVNRSDTRRGGREAEHLSACSFHLTSTVRLNGKSGHIFNHFSTSQGGWEGSSANGRKNNASCAKWPRTRARSTCRAQCACNASHITQPARIRRYVVQASCLGLYYATTNMHARVPAPPTPT